MRTLSVCHRIIHQISWLHVFLAIVAAQNRTNAQPELNNLYNNFDPSMAILVIILVCAFFILGFIYIYVRHFTESSVPLSSTHQPSASGGVMPIQGTIEENRLPRAAIPVKFSRSHTTGHTVLIPPGDNIERYTLRLPKEIRRQILTPEVLKRTRSYNAIFPREGSSRRGYRNGGGERSSEGKWVFSMAAPFVSRTGSVMSQKIGGGDGYGSNLWRGPTAVSR
ncbi:hypothetical protein SLEP1_g29041 [Rubroshorea leprosula]|uniref:Uncharacterized protein n=1 Tax=Rubroshorea leprosula TaxID=152421 RepID=A0AAV5K7G1_9ROSI|nr:hypothetical protein SLEP1_g29041 [Rubroshorea leprosula]